MSTKPSNQPATPKKLRIINLLASKRLGGVEQAFLDYNEALLQRGHQVLAVVHQQTKIREKLEAQKQLTIKYASLSHLNYFLVLTLYKSFKEFAPDAIITHSKKMIPILRLVAALLKVPLIGVAHNPKYKLINRCDAVFSITDYQKQIFTALGYPHNRIFVIPNLIKIDQPYQTRKWHNPPVIGTMGRFDPMKGFAAYLQALAALKQTGTAFQALLGGSPQPEYPDEPVAYEQIIKTNQLEKYVKLIGWVENKDAFFDQIDIFVLPSNYEPFGIVLLEAMRRSVPIVTSDAEGPTEIFANAPEAAFIFHRDNPQSLQKKLSQALANPEQTKAMAKHAYQLCQNTYSLSAVAQKLETAIRIVINRH